MNNDNNYSGVEYLLVNLNYYDKKAIINKRLYSILIIINTTISALIPFVTLFLQAFNSVKYIIGFMGSVTAILSFIIATFKFHKNWIEYRCTAEELKYHQYLYYSNSEPYNTPQKDSILILNVGIIIRNEHNNWKAILLNNNSITKNP